MAKQKMKILTTRTLRSLDSLTLSMVATNKELLQLIKDKFNRYEFELNHGGQKGFEYSNLTVLKEGLINTHDLDCMQLFIDGWICKLDFKGL